MASLPPGQIETRRFPVVGERTPSTLEGWELQIGGLVPDPRSVSLDEYMSMTHRDLIFDIHCVTSWTRFSS